METISLNQFQVVWKIYKANKLLFSLICKCWIYSWLFLTNLFSLWCSEWSIIVSFGLIWPSLVQFGFLHFGFLKSCIVSYYPLWFHIIWSCIDIVDNQILLKISVFKSIAWLFYKFCQLVEMILYFLIFAYLNILFYF